MTGEMVSFHVCLRLIVFRVPIHVALCRVCITGMSQWPFLSHFRRSHNKYAALQV
jgi:hypothetical protein